jgi:hypothetical protein
MVTFQPSSIDTRDYLFFFIVVHHQLLLFDYYLIYYFIVPFHHSFSDSGIKFQVFRSHYTSTIIKQVNKHHTADCTVFVLV